MNIYVCKHITFLEINIYMAKCAIYNYCIISIYIIITNVILFSYIIIIYNYIIYRYKIIIYTKLI